VGPLLTTITFVGERQDIIDADAAVPHATSAGTAAHPCPWPGPGSQGERDPASYDVAVAAPVKSIEELQERVDQYARPRTADDVSITSDGRRLDTKEKVLAFLKELAHERAASTPHGDRTDTS
jgi:hypothetical protein